MAMHFGPKAANDSGAALCVTLGIGCDRGVSLRTLEEAVQAALASLDYESVSVCGLASIDKKSDEVALLAMAEKHGIPLQFFSAHELAQVKVPNPSDVVMKHMGTPAVAEAAAMLAGNTGIKGLLVEKFKYKGADEKNATVSVVKTNFKTFESP
jgi:cobalt-precorrin 5A hydrolase